MQTRKFKNNKNMAYNAETDEYTCANGRYLRPVYTKKRKNTAGHEAEATVYECESSEGCPVKENARKRKGTGGWKS